MGVSKRQTSTYLSVADDDDNRGIGEGCVVDMHLSDLDDRLVIFGVDGRGQPERKVNHENATTFYRT